MEWIDYGLSVLTPAALKTPGADLAGVFKQLAQSGLLAGFPVSDRFYHVGDSRALSETDVFLRSLGSAGPAS
jgi:hypothetical protein